jgi:hypothetical protein
MQYRHLTIFSDALDENVNFILLRNSTWLPDRAAGHERSQNRPACIIEHSKELKWQLVYKSLQISPSNRNDLQIHFHCLEKKVDGRRRAPIPFALRSSRMQLQIVCCHRLLDS